MTEPIETPEDIRAALEACPDAERAFDTLPPSHVREYLTWVAEAKKPQTRACRIEGMIQRLAPAGRPGGSEA